MELFVLQTHRLRVTERNFIADHLTRPGSDFQRAILAGGGGLTGTIAICLDQGEIIGWARTEIWDGLPTLEAFVSPAYRRRGVATLCAAGLRTEGVFRDYEFVAVFRMPMATLAKRLGLLFAAFDRAPDGSWVEGRFH
jgi:GNAT superfamily N-acetyltransferase